MKVNKNKDSISSNILSNLPKGAVLFLILIILILSLVYLTGSVSFTTSLSISPLTDKRPDTNDTLTCSWNASGDTTQENVSWYKDSISFKNETDPSGSQSIISSDNTTRGEVWNCTIILSNGTNTTTQTVNVTIKNAPPTTPVMANSTGQDIGNNTNVTEDQANVFNLSATDPDGDTVTYGNFDSLPSGSTFDSNTGVFSWTPDYDNSDVNITFYAKDNQTPFENTNKFVMFIVQYVNDAPYFSPALTDQPINESEVFNYYIYGTDEENNIPFNFSINVTPSLDLIINITSNTSAVITFEGNRTATYDEAGNYTINVTIYDNQSANTTSSFNLEILQMNVEPVLENISTQNGTQGQAISFYVYADDSDVNDTLNFSINITPGTCSISNPWSISTTNSSHNATGLVNISNLTNNHVICRYVRIIVIDGAGAEDSQDVFLNVSNTNDPPNIEVLSSYSNHTGGNNITNLTGYLGSPFVYKVNVTDIDEDTYEGEVFAYSNNATSLFNISNTGGWISFTPNQSQIGNHTILINVSDDQGLDDTQVMNLEIRNNTVPVLMSIGNLSCAEDNICFIVINASDVDNENLTFTSNNTAVFNLTDNLSQSPVIGAYVNYIPNQSQIGNYSIAITVTDIRGAFDNEIILFTINNTNDAPVIQSFSFPKIVATHTVSFYVYANDQDYDLPEAYTITNISGSGYNLTEYVTFNDTNITGKDLFNISTYLNTSNNKTYTLISFTPGLNDIGNYSVNISAIDYSGAVNWTVKNFTVLNKTNPPNITQIRPYGRPVSSQTIFNFTNTSLFNGTTQTAINFSENKSVLYNITVTDDTTAQENLTYAWYINASLNSTNAYLNISYDFFSSGLHNITVIVSDDMYENVSWTWNVTVSDVNRAPRLLNPLNNISNVTATTIITNYLKKTTAVHFLDPDDDLNSNNDFDTNETSSLTYNVTSCSVATITFSGHSISVVPEEVGSCTVYFTANDSGGLTNTSNVVWINITSVPNATTEVETPQPTSGGGGGRTRSIVIPITKREDKPKTIEIIVPELVTVYKNKTVLIPITIKNNWNSSLMEVRINASTNDSYVEFEFTEDYFEELGEGEKRNITLIVSNYRLGENYEIRIIANVTNPKVSDSALVLLNSIEQAQEGENVETKVTFAQDLLSDNPECSELNELLLRAVEELESGSREEASKMVSGVIDGCKYLVSISKKAEQQPQSIITKFLIKENLKYFLIFLGLVVVIVLTTMIIKKRKTKTTIVKEKEEKKPEEEEVKPYWP